MQALSLSSGDPVLDRRLDWARGMLESGDAAAAAELVAETVRDAPDFLAGWFLLGEARERAGARDAAVAAFRRALALDSSDRLGAGLRLARLGEAPARAMSPAYVRGLFDQYAARFDRELIDHLGYCGPAVMIAAIDRVAGASFRRVLDLGCGTGLMGAAIRSRAELLVGIDLSPAMLAEARTKGIYDRLVEADLVDGLAAENCEFDLVLAADVLAYFHDLAAPLAAAARVLAPHGLTALTLERHAGEGAILDDTLRYAHGAAHLRAAAAAAGLTLAHLAPATTRTEKREAVDGWVAVLSRGRTTGCP
jgi:predicted TPR repeat methyltransferase